MLWEEVLTGSLPIPSMMLNIFVMILPSTPSLTRKSSTILPSDASLDIRIKKDKINKGQYDKSEEMEKDQKN